MIEKIYHKYILKYPLSVLLAVFICVSFLGYFASDVKIDATSDTLLLHDDKDLEFAQKVSDRYKTSDFLVVVLTPKTSLFSSKTISLIEDISRDLENLELVSSVSSIVNAPLFLSPVISMSGLVKDSITIKSPKVDLKLAKQEFLTSPLYKNLFVSDDFKTTGLIVSLKTNHTNNALIKKRNSLLRKDNKNSAVLDEIDKKIKHNKDIFKEQEHLNIIKIRKIISKYDQQNKIFLSGVSIIADDIVEFIKRDIAVYGSILILLLIVILFIIFRNPVWVILPILICTLSIVATTGAIGLFGWNISVVSSNFIAIQLIITISIILHLIVRYREVVVKYPRASQKRIVLDAILSKLQPSFFAIATTVAGFSSLMFANILPIVDLGAMMSVGIILSLIITFLVFPTILVSMPVVGVKNKTTAYSSFVTFLINIISSNKNIIFSSIFVLVILSIMGISKLFVENSFINYFKSDTQIYQGLKAIDTKLGGTTPLDIILTFGTDKSQDNFIDNFLGDMLGDTSLDELYWFSDLRMNEILKVHNYLESLDEIGYVRSFASVLETAKIMNKGKYLTSMELALLNKALPQRYKNMILSPYISIDKNQARFTTRIIDSNKNLRRNDLLHKIQKDLNSIVSKENTVRLSGLMVLYNNMLQSLFNSQIKTLGVVTMLLFVMFLLLFSSIRIAFIAIIANVVPIGVVFAIMGIAHIPLDIMTITIAAISIGIGVDGSIHYIYRFQKELKKDNDYLATIERTHNGVGIAITYTSIAIMVGFSILMLSNLVPTIYFGLLVVIVMFAILLSSLLFLPKLLLFFRPFK